MVAAVVVERSVMNPNPNPVEVVEVVSQGVKGGLPAWGCGPVILP